MPASLPDDPSKDAVDPRCECMRAPEYRGLLQLVVHVTGAPVAFIALTGAVTSEFHLHVSGDLDPSTAQAFASHVAGAADLLVATDPASLSEPSLQPRLFDTPGGILFGAGVPLLDDDGSSIGALCVMDRVSRTLTPEQSAGLRLVGQQAVNQIELLRSAEEAAGAEARIARIADFGARIAENMTNGMAALDVNGRFIYANRRASEMTGYPEEDLVGLSVVDLLDPEALPIVGAQLASILSDGATITNFETELRRRDGASISISFSAGPLRDGDRIVGIAGVAEDITERKRSERLHADARRLIDMVATGGMLSDILRQLALTVEAQSGALCSIMVLEEDGETLRVGAAPSFPKTLLDAADGIKIGPAVGSSGTAAYRKAPVISRDVEVDPLWADYRELMAAHGLRSAWSAPAIGRDSAVLGTIALYGREPGVPTAWELDVIAMATHMAALSIGRDRVLRRVAQSEERLRSFVRNAPVVLFALDRDGVFTQCEGRGLLELGWKPEQFVGRSIFELNTTEPKILEYARRGLAGESFVDVLELRGIAFEVHHTALQDRDGQQDGVIGVLINVNERRRAEALVEARTLELEQSKQHLEEKSAELERALRDEHERARRDPLTGLLNHAAITEQLRDLTAADGARLALAMVDVDGLKAANDTYGHQIGDAVLTLVARQLERDGAIVGRYGGDEFVAILPRADRAGANRYREDVLSALASAGLIDPASGASVPVVVSIGTAVFPDEAEAVDDLIRLSDSAMYASRRQRPADEAGRTLSRTLGGDRAAKMVGEIVPLLTSPGGIDEKLRLVSHRLSVGAGYDGVHFVIDDDRETGVASSAFARVPEEDLQEWNEQQASNINRTIAKILNNTRHPIIIDDIASTDLLMPDVRTGLVSAGFASCLIAPMFWESDLIGAMSVGSKQRAAFSVRDSEFVGAVATQVTAIVQMSRVLERLRTSSAHLQEAHESTVLMLASAAEAHDRTTGRHLERVRRISEAIARELGYDTIAAKELGMAATLHDIGKIRVPDSVLGSSQSLAEAEWVLMKQHTTWGAAFLTGQPGFELAAMVARCHHERWDGEGYPDGLRGEEIPEAARITTVADSFDAMTSDRPYRNGRPISEAVAEIVSCSAAQFSPDIVGALVRLFERGELEFLGASDDVDERIAA